MLFSSSTIRRRTFSCMRGDLTIRGTEYRPAVHEVAGENWLLCVLFRLLRRQRSALGAE